MTKAVEQFQAILKIQPDDAIPRCGWRGCIALKTSTAEAEKVLREILQRDPDNGPALEQLSQLLMDEGRSQEAVELFSQAAGELIFTRYLRSSRRRVFAE